jgi:hypothetical protein
MSPLLDIAAFARAAGVEVTNADLAAGIGGCEAVIAPRESGGFAVLVDPTPVGGWPELNAARRADLARRRFRFRAAHEVGHTLFYVRVSGRAPVRLSGSSSAEESFCDWFASSLLLPDVVLRRCPGLSQLLTVQRRYDVSLEVAARSWARVHCKEAALFFWTESSRRVEVQWTNAAACAANASRKKLAAVLCGVTRTARSSRELLILPARKQALALIA